ncbi:arsenate-mycothiol transferase ArsC2 [archaeon BMS3Abin16]|nr:arsenate-mycothiol transferase ArsC2 [archaeon BMS3Abin16]GBE56537.1 arsenate-mycothiol transferase ArsC2 [archaeon BMS3Bbin16]
MKTVLFVCVGNSARSQMAEALFNKHAPPGWQAESAGTKPAESVSKKAVLAMKEIGIDLTDTVPKKLTTQMLSESSHVISMGCGVEVCPANIYQNIVDWELDDPVNLDMETVRKIRSAIETKVKELIQELTG